MLLIPFGLQKDSRQYVDVADVPNGKSCDCICPSCHCPLIANQGDVNEWHFSHDSRYKDAYKYQLCDYSWSVALRLMSIQLLKEHKTICLPDLKKKFIEYDSPTIEITRTSVFKFNSIAQADTFSELKLVLSGYELRIFLGANSRSPVITLPERYNHKPDEGILFFDLSAITKHTDRHSFQNASDWVLDFIISNSTGREWLYHPREKIVERNLRRQHSVNRRAVLNAKRVRRKRKKQNEIENAKAKAILARNKAKKIEPQLILKPKYQYKNY